jgi:hypothetical protein
VANLNAAPMVVARRRTVKFGDGTSGQRESINLDMTKQGLSDIQFLMKAITIEDTRKQEKAGNPATRLAVDSREGKPLKYAQRRTEVTFGSFLDRLLIRNIERELIMSIRRTTQRRTGKLQNINNWEWIYYEKKGDPGKKMNPRRLNTLPSGAKLVLRPTRSIPYASWANWAVARKGQDVTPSRGKNKGVTRTTNQGFMAGSIKKLKRSRLSKNYTIWISFSKQYQVAGETYPHGSPSIVVSAKRKRRGYKRFT